jgi:hypothetical protein
MLVAATQLGAILYCGALASPTEGTIIANDETKKLLLLGIDLLLFKKPNKVFYTPKLFLFFNIKTQNRKQNEENLYRLTYRLCRPALLDELRLSLSILPKNTNLTLDKLLIFPIFLL